MFTDLDKLFLLTKKRCEKLTVTIMGGKSPVYTRPHSPNQRIPPTTAGKHLQLRSQTLPSRQPALQHQSSPSTLPSRNLLPVNYPCCFLIICLHHRMHFLRHVQILFECFRFRPLGNITAL